MKKLSKAQARVLDEIQNAFDGDDGKYHTWHDTQFHKDGTITCNYNSATLRVLEEMRHIKVIEYGNKGMDRIICYHRRIK